MSSHENDCPCISIKADKRRYYSFQIPRKVADISHRKRASFSEKLCVADKILQRKYSFLRAEVISYGLKSRISALGDTFRLHKIKYMIIAIRGRRLKLYFRLDPFEYRKTTYPLRNVSSIGLYRETPAALYVSSDLSMRRAKRLIADTMMKAGIKKTARRK